MPDKAPRPGLHYPDLQHPPSPACSYCGAPARAYHARLRQARYACGATTTMLHNDVHLDGTDAQKRAQLATWRQLLRGAGISDPMEGTPSEPDATARIYQDLARVTTDDGEPVLKLGRKPGRLRA